MQNITDRIHVGLLLSLEEYKSGIDETNAGKALAEAEQIINAHPEYMLHMMNMYSDLAKAA